MEQKFKDISHLIAARILGTPLSEAENKRLDDWLRLSADNRALYERIQSQELAGKLLRLNEADYGKRMATRFSREVLRRKMRTLLWRVSGVAAMLALVFTLSFYFLKSEKRQYIMPGRAGAMLTLTDGRQMDISEMSFEKLGELVSSAVKEDAADTVRYNTLAVNAGQEYALRLPDSSRVWVNSMSELRFPAAFAQGERKVYLKGEAFFEVKKNPAKPFVVTLGDAEIVVYGTRFNVSCYEGEPVTTVLVEGNIGFRAPGRVEVRLEPSERLEYNPATKEVEVNRVDISRYVAWVDHHFVFHGQTLEEIMKTLSRWYNFKPVFTSESVKQVRLSGRLYRYDDIRILLDSYENTSGLKFKIQDQEIIISEQDVAR